MKITKYAQSCLLIEKGGVKLLTDPGSWNKTPEAGDIAGILITHEHFDHVDPGQVKALIAGNPGVRVITLAEVGEKVLCPEGIAYETIAEGETKDVNGVSVRAYGHDHAIIYGDTPPCRNSGFLIAGKLFITGDALHDVPDQPVDILALPTGGPWMKIAEAVDYAKRVKPRVVFPVHDAMYTDMYQRAVGPAWIGGMLKDDGIEFRDMPNYSSAEF